MEENRKILALALVVILGGNTGNIIDTINPKGNYTQLDGELLRADMLGLYTSHIIAEQMELEQIRQRISECEYKVNK